MAYLSMLVISPSSAPATRSFKEAKSLAFRKRVELNKSRVKDRDGNFRESYFNGVDIAARPAVFERDPKYGGRSWCVASFDYADERS